MSLKNRSARSRSPRRRARSPRPRLRVSTLVRLSKRADRRTERRDIRWLAVSLPLATRVPASSSLRRSTGVRGRRGSPGRPSVRPTALRRPSIRGLYPFHAPRVRPCWRSPAAFRATSTRIHGVLCVLWSRWLLPGLCFRLSSPTCHPDGSRLVPRARQKPLCKSFPTYRLER